jgi:hypothetical protein
MAVSGSARSARSSRMVRRQRLAASPRLTMAMRRTGMVNLVAYLPRGGLPRLWSVPF